MPMTEMTTRERYARMFAHKDADRIPIIDSPWSATIERWHAEGLPDGVGFEDYFGTDRVVGIDADCSARYPHTVIEETDEYLIACNNWGVTTKNWKHAASTPQYLGFTIVDGDSWNAAKERMAPSDDRINWDHLRRNYADWRTKGRWIQGHPWFGFDATHAGMVGTERVLMAMIEDPEWIADIFNFCLDISLTLLDRIWDAGYTFDSLFWCDDMGFKHNQFFSLRTYRELLKPAHARAVAWAHAKGIPAHLHSCGDVRKFVPDLVEIGIDALNPLEVKAGMDPYELKRTYGDKLVLHGGLNALLYDDIDATEAEIRKLVPAMKEHGGYIFSSDHSVPSSVSLEGFGRIVSLAKELGRYD
jgi:uroporphyrinogen decarboxylase